MSIDTVFSLGTEECEMFAAKDHTVDSYTTLNVSSIDPATHNMLYLTTLSLGGGGGCLHSLPRVSPVRGTISVSHGPTYPLNPSPLALDSFPEPPLNE